MALGLEILILASLLMLHLETIKDEIVEALRANISLLGRVRSGAADTFTGRLPDLDAMAQAKMKAHTHGDDST